MQRQHQNIGPRQQIPKEPVHVLGVPSVSALDGRLVVGDAHSSSYRTYVPLKSLGHGSFGSVTLCDWGGDLAFPLSAMQMGRSRPEWKDKKLVALKRMRRPFKGGWSECEKLHELRSLRSLSHPNVVRLYDFFLVDNCELHLVLEPMEGNLLQLLDSRKGRVLAGGLSASIFHQVVSGLDCIHAHGWFHRDMKPDNLLITTTGLHDYEPLSHAATRKTDVVVIVKIADFGLACEINRRSLHTPYVSTRWYRAPEVILHARDYSSPVDMWALGTIMVEVVTLRPLFPGKGELDQMSRICEVLGDTCDGQTVDARGRPLGGGAWPKGVEMARSIGCNFPKIPPKDLDTFFDHSVPITLIDCIKDLLKYDPERRLTSRQCLEHPYFTQTARAANVPMRVAKKTPPTIVTERPPRRTRPPLEERCPTPVVTSFDAMDISPPTSPIVFAKTLPPTTATTPKPALKKASKWGLGGMFSGAQPGASSVSATAASPVDNKKAQKEVARRLLQEADQQKHALMARNLKEQSRAVVQNRQRANDRGEPTHILRVHEEDIAVVTAGPRAGKEKEVVLQVMVTQERTVVEYNNNNAVAGPSSSYAPPPPPAPSFEPDLRSHKARRRDEDDDHSMSSVDTYEADRISYISTDTSEYGSRRLHPMASCSSLATTVDGGYGDDAHSLSSAQEHNLASEFRKRASLDRPCSPMDVIQYPHTPRGPGDHHLVNPMFKVPQQPQHTRLPPFSELAAVADGGAQRPYSPITFSVPDADW